jgi:Family of unknown function (DUF6308)
MVPDGWQLPPPDLLVEAERKALQAMRTDGPYPAPDRLARFYDADGDYAGASFAQLGPVDPMDITPTDLLATTLLSVPDQAWRGQANAPQRPHERQPAAKAQRHTRLRSCECWNPSADGNGATL